MLFEGAGRPRTSGRKDRCRVRTPDSSGSWALHGMDGGPLVVVAYPGTMNRGAWARAVSLSASAATSAAALLSSDNSRWRRPVPGPLPARLHRQPGPRVHPLLPGVRTTRPIWRTGGRVQPRRRQRGQGRRPRRTGLQAVLRGLRLRPRRSRGPHRRPVGDILAPPRRRPIRPGQSPLRAGVGGRARTGHGLGLGLSIVRAIATAHDAKVTATPRPEGGLTVSVTFTEPDALLVPEDEDASIATHPHRSSSRLRRRSPRTGR